MPRNWAVGFIITGGDALVAKGVKSLKALSEKIDTTKMPNPSFMMILTADGDFIYRTDDGILVCPIGCIKGSARL